MGGNNAYLSIRSKSNNNETKKLTHHEIIDRIAEQTASVIVQVRKESKLSIHPNLRWPRF